jgi:hypothetical protein
MVTVNLRSRLLAVTCAAGIVAGAAETASSFELVDISATISTNAKFWGAAVAGDGRVVFAPANADGVGVFDPTDDSFSLVNISATISRTLNFPAPLWRAMAGWCSPLISPTAWGCSIRRKTVFRW